MVKVREILLSSKFSLLILYFPFHHDSYTGFVVKTKTLDLYVHIYIYMPDSPNFFPLHCSFYLVDHVRDFKCGLKLGLYSPQISTNNKLMLYILFPTDMKSIVCITILTDLVSHSQHVSEQVMMCKR